MNVLAMIGVAAISAALFCAACPGAAKAHARFWWATAHAVESGKAAYRRMHAAMAEVEG